MCGLLGMASPEGFREADFKFHKELLKISCLRGVDSTGVLSYEREGNAYEVRKECKPSPLFVDNYGFKFLKNEKANIYLSHTRWGTTGGRSKYDAHPFDVDGIVGAHNGTMKDREFQKGFKTDSEQLFEKISKKGLKETLDDVDYYSAFALTIFEKDTQDLIFVRNNDRPLFFGIHPTRPLFVWGSDIDMMEYARKKADLKVFKYYDAQPFMVYRVPLDLIKGGEEDHPWKTFKIKKPKTPVMTRTNWGEVWENHGWSEGDDDWLAKYMAEKDKKSLSSNIIPLGYDQQALVDEYMVDKVAFVKKYPNLIDGFGNLSMSNVKSYADMNDRLPF